MRTTETGTKMSVFDDMKSGDGAYLFQITIEGLNANESVSINMDSNTGCWTLGDTNTGINLSGGSSMTLSQFRATRERVTFSAGSEAVTPVIVVYGLPAATGNGRFEGTADVGQNVTVLLSANGQTQTIGPNSTGWNITY
jgi:hypothetical protein